MGQLKQKRSILSFISCNL